MMNAWLKTKQTEDNPRQNTTVALINLPAITIAPA